MSSFIQQARPIIPLTLFYCSTAVAVTNESIPELQLYKDLTTILNTIVSMIVTSAGIFWGLASARQAIQEKRNELRQKQLSAANDIIEKLFIDHFSNAAMRLIDWSGREIINNDHAFLVNWSDLKPALRAHTPGSRFTEKEAIIRDCFERFFDRLVTIEHFISLEYLKEEDIAIPLGYYASLVIENIDTYQEFLDAYGYKAAHRLLLRFAKSYELYNSNSHDQNRSLTAQNKPFIKFNHDIS